MNTHVHSETLAEYIAGDLPEGELSSVEGHLEGCDSCRLVLGQLREAAEALAQMVHLTPAPVGVVAPGRAPSLRWFQAAAAVLGLLLVTTGGSVAAPFIAKSWAGLTPREIPAAQAHKQIEHILQTDQEVRQQNQYRYLTPAEAEQQWDELGLATVANLPQGYKLSAVRVGDTLGRRSLLQTYTVDGPNFLQVSQFWSGGAGYVVDYPEGAGSSVLVGGREALLVQGAWQVTDGQKPVWGPDRVKSLHFEWNGQQVTVVAAGLAAEELIAVAGSLK